MYSKIFIYYFLTFNFVASCKMGEHADQEVLLLAIVGAIIKFKQAVHLTFS